MVKTTKLNDVLVLSLEHEQLTVSKLFNRVLGNFIKMPTGVFSLLETLILTGIIIEAVIKNLLKKISPVLTLEVFDPINIALVSGKRKKLVADCKTEVSDIKSAPITVLLERFLKFYPAGKYPDGLRSYFALRNKIIHSAENVSLEENRIGILLTKTIFPFIKQYVDVSGQIWSEIEKITMVVHDTYKANLLRKILEHRKVVAGLQPLEIERLIKIVPKLGKDEFFFGEGLNCPSCGHPSVDVVGGVEFEYEGTYDGEIEYTTSEYCIIKCSVCNLNLDKEELEEVFENPKAYFLLDGDLKEWKKVLQMDYFELYRENNYSLDN